MDRNIGPLIFSVQPRKSLSARRAWIEILHDVSLDHKEVVALRKESVDRNVNDTVRLSAVSRSLSARRAWIEISPAGCWRDARRVALRKESVDRNCLWDLMGGLSFDVALRKESVDRNFVERCNLYGRICRSPQGERG